jgi:hypothetical protein
VVEMANMKTADAFLVTDNLSVSQSNPQSAIHKWRLVSQGIHVDLINNAEDNDGWWEAARFGCPTDAKNYLTGLNSDKLVGPIPWDGFNLSSSEISNLPSYTSGALRHIGQFKFQLLPEGGDHDFIEVRNDYNLQAEDLLLSPGFPPGFNQLLQVEGTKLNNVDGSELTAPEAIIGFSSDGEIQHEFVNTMVDTNYDCVFLRLHCQVTDRPSRMKVSVVANHEIVYDERSALSRFHQKTPKHPGFEGKKDGKRDKPLAEPITKKID